MPGTLYAAVKKMTPDFSGLTTNGNSSTQLGTKGVDLTQ